MVLEQRTFYTNLERIYINWYKTAKGKAKLKKDKL